MLMTFIWYLPAAAIGICVAASANFLLNDRLVFRLWSRSGASATIPEPRGSASIADGGPES